MSGVLMFCGELRGMIEPCHIAFTAREVRGSIGALFAGRTPEKRWSDAAKEGWCVVKVKVEKLERRTP